MINKVASKPKFRGTSHFYTFLASLIAGIPLIIFSESLLHRTTNIIFALSVTLLFGVSATYHLRDWKPKGDKLMRALDHSSIYFLIAGTYTSMVVSVVESNMAMNILIFVWLVTLLGILVEFFAPRIPPWLSSVIYVGIGWTSILVAKDFITNIGLGTTLLILTGGLFYTVGAVIYALKRPNPWPKTFGYHEVFHVCTIVGAGLHYYVIMKMYVF